MVISLVDVLKPRRLSICLFFRASLGGLQENVLTTAVGAIGAGWEVSILCPAGRFIEEHLRPLGIESHAVDFQSASSVEQARAVLCLADVIHAHPGPSRKLALEAATISGAPVVFTIHGAWFDSVQQYAQRLAAIVCVSPAVQEAVSRLCPDHPAIHCIPNGIDTARFGDASRDVRQLGHIVVASRLDADKRMLIDTLIRLWEVQAKRVDRHVLRYTVAGEGTLRCELESAAQRLDIPVHFAGWLTTDALASIYGQASAVIASGRGAIEGLAAGRPTLALASAGAVEAFEPSQIPNAAHSNFGGYGAKPPQSIEALFEGLRMAATSLGTEFEKQAIAFVHTHHDSSAANAQLLGLYDQSCCRMQTGPWGRLSRHVPLLVTAGRLGNKIIGRCEASREYFQGELEYAFYLMIGGEKAQVEWYTPNPEACFALPDDVGEKTLEVLGFVREKANPEKKLVRGAMVPRVVGS